MNQPLYTEWTWMGISIKLWYAIPFVPHWLMYAAKRGGRKLRDPDNLHLGKSRRLGLWARSQKECRELIRWATFLGQPMVFVCALSHILKNPVYLFLKHNFVLSIWPKYRQTNIFSAQENWIGWNTTYKIILQMHKIHQFMRYMSDHMKFMK